ncbi:hypothetical protein [Rubellimicrobium roseum]|uniref:Uncharacterized protein n=1 Tax=Rubellimicrobium roseum TaxID=687525 RepID=A0A5C4NIX2_9RHOB|nr:hypothetical protein [Rubellimicrobium roseum]TNC73358.1 hypothetical protein FHG71_05810 [Rubellimicrobium roseum]
MSMLFRGVSRIFGQSRQNDAATVDPHAGIEGAAAPVPVARRVLDDFHEARLVDRRAGVARPFDGPGDVDTEGPAAALESVLKAIEAMAAELGLEDAPKDIVVTTRREFQILRFRETDPETYVFARLDREGVALPEARLRVKDLELTLGT